jgi:hypothetical protein
MSNLNDVERLNTGLEDPSFFPQRYNCTALKVMSAGEERED